MVEAFCQMCPQTSAHRVGRPHQTGRSNMVILQYKNRINDDGNDDQEDDDDDDDDDDDGDGDGDGDDDDDDHDHDHDNDDDGDDGDDN